MPDNENPTETEDSAAPLDTPSTLPDAAPDASPDSSDAAPDASPDSPASPAPTGRDPEYYPDTEIPILGTNAPDAAPAPDSPESFPDADPALHPALHKALYETSIHDGEDPEEAADLSEMASELPPEALEIGTEPPPEALEPAVRKCPNCGYTG